MNISPIFRRKPPFQVGELLFKPQKKETHTCIYMYTYTYLKKQQANSTVMCSNYTSLQLKTLKFKLWNLAPAPLTTQWVDNDGGS